ncbi:trimeric LpxA-like enzyme isoform 5, partial [Haematococcus lacustris]
VLKLLYDKDILAEEAMLAWADEKENGDEEDKTYVLKHCPNCDVKKEKGGLFH